MSKVKICGIKNLDEIRIMNAYKPDFVGFIFAKNSKRYIDFDTAKRLKNALDKDILSVGVFCDATTNEICKTLDFIDIIQLHANEDDDYIKELKSLTNKPIIKAFGINDKADLEKALKSSADYVLLDYKVAGSGKSFDWGLLAGFSREYFLAGGLNISNLDKAKKLNPYALDISSGVEINGFKDEKMVKDFIQGVRMKGRFGIHGGQYMPETLMNAVIELEKAYEFYKNDENFNQELQNLLNDYANRPSRLYYAKSMTKDLGGAKIYLKREDLNHTGAHKINNVLGQALLAKKMGKTRLIAETGAGQHGVATATAAALFGMECVVYMGEEDTIRQALNVYRMKLLGAKVVSVKSGTATLKDAVSATLKEWVSRMHDTHYCLGSVMGPHPFPTMVRDFQAVISKEIKEQILSIEGKLPNAVLACVGGGSNAIGSFYHFINDLDVELIGCEAAGDGIDTPKTAATINVGSVGIFHGMKSYFCQDKYGQIAPVYSISAGLDYPGVGPEHAYLHDIKRAKYVGVTDAQAVKAFEYLTKVEGIIPAIESAHAVYHAMQIAPKMPKDSIIVVTLSGRGDKDCAAIARYKGENIYE